MASDSANKLSSKDLDASKVSLQKTGNLFPFDQQGLFSRPYLFLEN